MNSYDNDAFEKLIQLSRTCGLDVSKGTIRRTSSRFCLGVEHGDYNGTELFGVGTDRFIWMAYSSNPAPRMRIFSGNYPEEGIIEFAIGKTPPPNSPAIAHTWARFPFGVNHILRREGYELQKGINAVIYGNIPGGGMSRSASLTLNLILSLFEVNDIKVPDKFKIVNLAQAVETDYIGSPCGQLDQIMILFAREGLGTHYDPKKQSIKYVPLGGGVDFRLVSLDTGTVRPGLEKSTYKIRRAECEEFVSILKKRYEIDFLADIKDRNTYEDIISEYRVQYPHLCSRLKYVFYAQKRFYEMLDAWKKGDIETVGQAFRKDGLGLRDDYKISGPELETMCDIARTVEGVFGERMLGGGDKGAAGAIVASDRVMALKQAVDLEYPRRYPQLSEKYAVHSCQLVEGVRIFKDWL